MVVPAMVVRSPVFTARGVDPPTDDADGYEQTNQA